MDYNSIEKLFNSRTKYSKLLKKVKRLSQKKLGSILFDCICENNEDIFDFVLPMLENPNPSNSFGETATMYAAHYRRATMFKKLQERGAKLGSTTNHSFSCLMDGANEYYVTSLFAPNLHFGMDIYRYHQFGGVNDLMYAVAGIREINNSAEIVKLILSSGEIDVNAKDADGYTALMYAAESGNVPAVVLLLEAGAEIDAQNKYGNTALMIALTRMHSDYMIKTLVLCGSDQTIKNNFGENAMDINRNVKERVGVDNLAKANRAKNMNLFNDQRHGRRIIKKLVNAKFDQNIYVEDDQNEYFLEK
ncbi:MAG: ankyrin repeat domain-containing protein [Clostridia bacterium]|nr:ankyrin repeat domain-containing protein [Clostridia bacterium]